MSQVPKLVVLSDQIQGKKLFELSEDVYTIGRSDDQSICLQDSTVSSRHCELIRNEDGAFNVQDLGSANGTRINGVRIMEQALGHSDILQVGGVEVLFHHDEGSVPTNQNPPQTGINLENTENGVQINQLANVNPLKSGSKKVDAKKVNLLITISISVLIVLVLVLAVFLLLSFLK